MPILESIKDWMNKTKPSNFIKIPLHLSKEEQTTFHKSIYKGELFVSPMPFGPYDPFNTLFKEYKSHKVSHIMMLVTDDEIQQKNKKKLKLINFYKANNIKVSRLPFQDLSAPPYEDLNTKVHEMIDVLKDRQKLVIHCNAGVGRTGILTACIVAKVLKLDGKTAIEYIKNLMMVNLTSEQENIIVKWTQNFVVVSKN